MERREEEEDQIEIFSEDSEEEVEMEKKDIIKLPKKIHNIYKEEEELLNKIAINKVLLEKLKKDLENNKLNFATKKMIIENVGKKKFKS